MVNYIKNKKIRRLLKRMFIAGIVILVLIVILVIAASLLKTSYRKLYKVSDEVVLEQSYNTVFSEININTKMTDIDIKQSADNTFKVITYGEKDYIKLNEKNNKLFIDINNKSLIFFNFYSCISKIELYLPNNYDKVIRINNEFGNIDIGEFNNLALDIKQKIGNLSISSLDFIKTESKNSDIKIDKAVKARLSNKNGKINVKEVDDLVIDNENGNVTIENLNEYLKINLDSGNIKIDSIKLIKDSNINLRYGNVILNKIEDINVDAKTNRGKKEIKNNNKKADIKLEIYNKSGDIKVN